MRIARSIQLHPEEGFVHKFWRCHNKEYYLSSNRNKDLYFESIREGLSDQITKGNVAIHAYCAMDNHFHQVVHYSNGSKHLSNFMRQAHGIFGARYNKSHKRSGKVAEGRPKTPLVENVEHLMRVQFYVEANPIRAGKCTLENLKNYKYSSYGYYAYGIETEFTKLLTVPEWYLELGRTRSERQRRYRKLFQEYVTDMGRKSESFLEYFIGSQLWKLKQNETVQKLIAQRLALSSDSS